MTRFWRPTGETPRNELSLVACIATSQYLYVLAEGPALPPPTDPYNDTQEMLLLHVTLASGTELPSLHGSGNNGKTGQQYVGKFSSPPEPSEPLTVKMTKEDGTLLWEIQTFPFG